MQGGLTLTSGGKREGAGRKPSPNPRSKKIMIRLSEEEYQNIVNAAGANNQTVSDIIRQALAAYPNA